MYFSLATFFADVAKENPVLYAILVVTVMVLVALAIHRILETVAKFWKM